MIIFAWSSEGNFQAWSKIQKENCKFRFRGNLKRGEGTNLVIHIAKYLPSLLQTEPAGGTALSALNPVRQIAATHASENKHQLV